MIAVRPIQEGNDILASWRFRRPSDARERQSLGTAWPQTPAVDGRPAPFRAFAMLVLGAGAWSRRPGSCPAARLASCKARRHSGVMPDRPYPAVDALIRRVQRIARNRPDPLHILAETISMTGAIDLDPYAVLGVLAEGIVHTIANRVPPERQGEAVATLRELLEERLAASGLTGGGNEPHART
jgi:hypothetical protein